MFHVEHLDTFFLTSEEYKQILEAKSTPLDRNDKGIHPLGISLYPHFHLLLNYAYSYFFP